MSIEYKSWNAPEVRYVAMGFNNPPRAQAMNCALTTFVSPDGSEENMVVACNKFDSYGNPLPDHVVTMHTVFLKPGEYVDDSGSVCTVDAKDSGSSSTPI